MRKLASIQRIKDIQPIENADAIEVATILGWKVVVKKGEFSVGDLIIYCEIDSVLPDRPEFEFLRKDKFRIRTVQLRGQISQGICFPINILPRNAIFLEAPEGPVIDVSLITGELGDVRPFEEGTDLTDVLGVTKYEPPIPAELAGEVVGPLPSFFQVTDEDRIQILPDIPQKYGGKLFIATEKIDGSSCSFYFNDGHFGVCGRNWEFVESSKNLMWRYARTKVLEEKLRELGLNIAIQGEIYGKDIQSNKYKLNTYEVRIFRIFDIDKYMYLPYDETVRLVKTLGLEMVPILDYNYVLPDNIDDILAYANGKSVINSSVNREGVVFVRDEVSHIGRLSFKVISNKFLIKNKE